MKPMLVRTFEVSLLSLALLATIYTSAYFLSVRRKVVWLGNAGAVTFKPLPAFRGSVPAGIFDAALALDRAYFRRHYWSGWYVVTNANGPEFIYDIDWQRPR